MIPDPVTYDLGELCELADVTPRTVRYYLQQGLLPSPGRQGPGTRYDRGHLDRLRLVKRLQREHLPLAEIRRRLDELSDAAVQALVEEPPPPPPRAARDGSAIAYIRDVLSGVRAQQSPQPALQPPPLAPPAARAPAASAPEADAAAASKSVAEDAEPVAPHALYRRMPPAPRDPGGGVSSGTTRATWERITLAPDVELHVRRPLTRVQSKLVDRLIAEARTLFDEDR